MKNWKIGIRIGAGFGAVILITAVLAVFSFSRVALMDQRASYISNDSLPGLALSVHLQNNLDDCFRISLEHILTHNKADSISCTPVAWRNFTAPSDPGEPNSLEQQPGRQRQRVHAI